MGNNSDCGNELLKVRARERRQADAVHETSALDGGKARLAVLRAHAVVLRQHGLGDAPTARVAASAHSVIRSSVPKLAQHLCATSARTHTSASLGSATAKACPESLGTSNPVEAMVQKARQRRISWAVSARAKRVPAQPHTSEDGSPYLSLSRCDCS